MRVLVVGGSGFLGSAVLRELARHGYHTLALARSSIAADRVRALGAEAVYGDLDDASSIGAAFTAARANVLANLASLGFGHASTIVSGAQEAGIQRALFVSTTAIFTSLAASSRAVRVAAEDTVRTSPIPSTIVRPTMIYGGPGDRNMERLLRFLRRSPVVPLPGGGDRLLQPVHVEDLAWFVVAALRHRGAEAVYNVAGPEALTLRQLIRQAATAAGRRPLLVSLPLAPAIAATRLYASLSRQPRITIEQVLRLDEDKAFDITPARSLGYRPRTFADGIGAEARLVA